MSGAATKTSTSSGAFSMIRLGIILALYAVAACTILALVNALTAPVIKANQERKANEAMKAVFAEAETFPPVDKGICGTSLSGTSVLDSIHLAQKEGHIIGAVAQVSGPTYDRSTIMVGMDTNGTITGMRYLENTDTPGFGQKGSDPTFTLKNGETFFGQFAGKSALGGFTLGKTFDAISGATITSEGIGKMMTDAAAWMNAVLEAHNE